MLNLLRSRRRARRGPRRRAHWAAAALLAAGGAGVSACSAAASGQTQAMGSGQSYVSGDQGVTFYRGSSAPAVPGVSGKTLTGAKLSLSAYRGHVVVLNFWGSWCAPCRSEAPALAALARHFQPAGVRFAGVDIRDNIAAAQAFEGKFGITYPSFNDPGGLIALDFHATVPPAGVPATVVVSPGGRIVARVIGEASYNGLKSLISRAVTQTS